MRLTLASSIVLAVAVSHTAFGQTTAGAVPGTATFRAGVELVTVSAVVRDGKGRVVSDLRQSDFELLDGGEPRAITSFRAEPAPISVALLFDVSGSMQVAAKIEKARVAARYVMTWLQPGRDELAVYSFDSGLRQRQPFALYQQDAALERSLVGLKPWGLTSLHDAIAATARELAARPTAHRAVIVLTDGVDNNSRLSAADVSGIASSIDVPVYILAVVSPLDHVGANTAVNSERPVPVGDLADLARWTGGECFVTSLPLQTSQAAQRIVEELRHQYLIAFEPAGRPGWRPLEVRTRGRRLVVRARSGYIAGSTKNGSSDLSSR
jgi:Ca-activated chloride channel homolog